MNVDIDQYLSTLLSFTPGHSHENRIGGDYVSLIHVPASGQEKVYSIAFGDEVNVLTVAQYHETIWEYMKAGIDSELAETVPKLNVLQVEVELAHPVFNIVGKNLLTRCENHSDGGQGLDYYLLMWQKSGSASVVECWEPYGRNDDEWITVIGAIEVLSSQFEYAAAQSAT